MTSDSKTWYSISVTVAPDAVEAIEYAFNSLDALGTEINHLKKKNLDTVTVVGYFNDLPNEDHVQDELHWALKAYSLEEASVLQLERNTIEDTDWLAEWKKHWQPSEVGNFVIAPPWSDVASTDKIVIRIEPNMAFGTGTHETTQLCLNAIERFYSPGDSFLDVGTGTGILAIAAAKINLRSGIADLKLSGVDTDPDSITIAKENAKLNEVADVLNLSIGSLTSEAPVNDFVCANLTIDVILPILELLVEKARKTLVMSGILADQQAEIVSALGRLGIQDPQIKRAGEWISVVKSS